MLRESVLVVALGLVTLPVLGHGEDKLGPHGGHIKMPGAFHTELVLAGPGKVNIYLLDFNMKNPSVRDSSVVLSLHGRGRVSAPCVQRKDDRNDDYFACEFPPMADFAKKGALVLEAQREKQKGQVVRYELPLPHVR